MGYQQITQKDFVTNDTDYNNNDVDELVAQLVLCIGVVGVAELCYCKLCL